MGKDYVVKPRKIRKPEDVRSDSNKGKLDRHAIWIVKIQMPKKLIADIYGGYNKVEELDNITAQETPQAADQTVDQTAVAAPEAAGEAV